MINKVLIRNYRTFESITLNCKPDLNIVVGDNEAGKSTILEAINLCLTKKLNGRFVESELSPLLFNRTCIDKYLANIVANKGVQPPVIRIEVYFNDAPELAEFKGINNELDENTCGISLEIAVDEELGDLYEKATATPSSMKTIPIECYRATWLTFAGNAVPTRAAVRTSLVDATTVRLHSGADQYVQDIIAGGLDKRELADVAHAFRRMKETFADQPAIKQINESLKDQKGVMSNQTLTVGIDLSARGSWQASLSPHLDAIPYMYVGKGEQNVLKVMLALAKGTKAHVLLIEEPETHLSFSTMNVLIDRITEKCKGQQLFISTHSPYVLNRLGLGHLLLLSNRRAFFLDGLSEETQTYFKRLPGYDTLRMVLAKKVILVEGPSDELLVQQAYLEKHKRLPAADGVDVISVRGLSFTRFLEIAKPLNIDVRVVTDNDGEYEERIVKKYKPFAGGSIRVFADANNALKTLEDHIAAQNTLATLNQVFGKTHTTGPELLAYMKSNKTEWALKVLENGGGIKIPKYITDAVA